MTMLKRHRRIEKSKTPIEDIISNTKIDEDPIRRKIWIEGVVLALPLLFSFAFYVNLIFKTTSPSTAQLSPPKDLESLILFVFVFILVYSIFLIFEYKHLKEKMGKNKKKKNPHKKLKKK